MDDDLIKDINKIVWWIPIKKLRDNIRNKLIYFINKISKIDEKINNVSSRLDNINCSVYNINNKLYKLTPQPYLLLIDVHLAEHCNLHCYSCNTFAQLSKEEYLDINIFERDMKRLFELTNGLIKEIHFLGGEPLLNKNCEDYFYIGRKYFKNSKLELWTNGILLLKEDENFWVSCKDNEVIIVITKYPINIDLDAIENKAKEFNIEIRYTNEEAKYSDKFVLSDTRKHNAFNSFTSCYMANSCVTLKDGKLYTCVLAAKINKFNNYYNKNLEVTELDYIDIHKAKSYTEILQFLSKPIPFCEYCDVDKWRTVGLWRHSTKDISEYTE